MSAALTGQRRPNRTLHQTSQSDIAEYDRLRGLAHTAHAKRKLCSERSQAAFKSSQKGLAKDLSNEAKEHGRVGDDYNRQARDYIFRVNNERSAGDEIDLHGLYVQEAKDILKLRIETERVKGGSGLHVIVGKGNHREGGAQKIKPAVEELCREFSLKYSIEQKAGRMHISLAPVGGVPVGKDPRPQVPVNSQTFVLHPPYGTFEHQPGLQKRPSSGYGRQDGLKQQQERPVLQQGTPGRYTRPISHVPQEAASHVAHQARRPTPRPRPHSHDLEAGGVGDPPQEPFLKKLVGFLCSGLYNAGRRTVGLFCGA